MARSEAPGRGAVSEFNHAVALANTVLDCPHCDPDADLAVLARQFLRARWLLTAAEARIAELEAEVEEDHSLRESMADKLTRIANIVKGQPPPLTLHSWHDLPEVVERALLDKK